MHYYLYEIKNIVNGKIYVGVHKTHNLNDGYMGSGKVIKRAIEKYGLDSFVKTILETFDTVEQMYAREKEIVNDEFLSRTDVYNLRRGGTGGFDFINSNNLVPADVSSKGGKAIAARGGGFLGRTHKDSSKIKMSESRKGREPGFKDCHHTDETKRKIGDANRTKSLGNKNGAKILDITDRYGNKFTSVQQCADFYKVSTTAIYKRIYRNTL